MPFHMLGTSSVVNFCLALALLYVAEQIAARKKMAWYVATGLLWPLLIVELVHYRNYLQLVLYGMVLVLLLRHRARYVVISDSVSMRRGLINWDQHVACGITVCLRGVRSTRPTRVWPGDNNSPNVSTDYRHPRKHL